MEGEKRTIRALIAKTGLDGHDRGVKVVVMGLRDEGIEVIYTGLRQTPEEIVRAAIQEAVDVVGLSILTGGHNYYLPRIAELLAQQGANDVLLIAGGIVPEDDIPLLNEKGVSAVFGPGTTIKEIADFIRTHVKH